MVKWQLGPGGPAQFVPAAVNGLYAASPCAFVPVSLTTRGHRSGQTVQPWCNRLGRCDRPSPQLYL